MKFSMIIFVVSTFVQLYHCQKKLILSESPSQIVSNVTLNQHKAVGHCLDNKEMQYGYEILGFNKCNEEKTQYWKFFSNGQIVQNITGLCIFYHDLWYKLTITNCNNTDKLQLWTKISTQNSQWMNFMNVGKTEQLGHQQCLVQSGGDYAQLQYCNQSIARFKFVPFPSKVFEGPIYSLNSNLCLDNLYSNDGIIELGFKKCNGDKNQNWKYLSNGQIIQQFSGKCVQYHWYWNALFLTDCQINYSKQIWNYQTTKNQQLQFINQGETTEKGTRQCMIQDGQFANLYDCNISSHNQLFSFVPPPPIPPSPLSPPPSHPYMPPALILASIKSKSSQQCLDNGGLALGYQMLNFRECFYTNIEQQWQFLANGHIIQRSSGMCISLLSAPLNWHTLMVTLCNQSDLLQFWIQESCRDNYCHYKNIGYSELYGQYQCIFYDEDGYYSNAKLDKCNYSDENQLFTFFPVPGPPSPPYYPPLPNDDDNDDSPGLPPFVIIIIVFGCIIFIIPILLYFRYVAQQHAYDQQQLYQLLQQQQNDSNDNNDSNVVLNRPREQQYQDGSDELEELVIQRQASVQIIRDRLLSETFQGGRSEVTCCICLDELREGDREIILPCTHQFHKKCFEEWLQIQGSRVACPLCNLHLRDNILP